jgi:hypothetical protein
MKVENPRKAMDSLTLSLAHVLQGILISPSLTWLYQDWLRKAEAKTGLQATHIALLAVGQILFFLVEKMNKYVFLLYFLM